MSGLPLDKQQVTDAASGKSFSALHQRWVKKRGFVAYVAPPADSSDQGMMGEWLERLQYICTDLHWLLQLSHQQFWCQVIFDESLHQTLDSFLQYCPRPYDTDSQLSGSSGSLHDQVSRLVFFTYLRMTTYKESKESWLTPKVFGEILYENFLLDIPKLLDLCALYGGSNAALLSKMVSNVFTQQPNYLQDLQEAIPTILQVMVSIADKCGVETQATGLEPQKLHRTASRPVDLVTMETGELQDVVLYLADTALTLTSFLSIYPPACSVLQELQFPAQMAHVYERLIPALESTLKQRHFELDRQKKMLRSKTRQARVHLLTMFHSIVSHTCLQPVLSSISKEGGDSEDVHQHLEDFLSIMSAVLGEKRFLADYEGQFSFQEDMDILSQAAGDIDEAHYRYISEAINSAFAAHGRRKKPKGNTNTGGRTSPDGSPCPASALSSAATPVAMAAASSVPKTTASPAPNSDGLAKSQSGVQGATAGKVVSEVEMESLVSAVHDLLPHLGQGFILLALEELGYSVEAVVSAVLEDTLPPALLHTDFSLHRVQRSVEEETVVPLLVESRRNIYDNDEFDVFANPQIDFQRVHKGKKSAETEKILEDKESVQQLKSMYDAYGSMDVNSMYDPHLYDDEYDDTYDTNNVGAKDADSADELTQRRSLTVPQVLRRPPDRAAPSEDSSSDEDQSPRDQFVQDPAKLREQQEQKRFARASNHRPPRDVKGKGKGQGQTEEVLRNRRMKEMNKGARANHNRRAMADKKHSKGMF